MTESAAPHSATAGLDDLIVQTEACTKQFTQLESFVNTKGATLAPDRTEILRQVVARLSSDCRTLASINPDDQPEARSPAYFARLRAVRRELNLLAQLTDALGRVVADFEERRNSALSQNASELSALFDRLSAQYSNSECSPKELDTLDHLVARLSFDVSERLTADAVSAATNDPAETTPAIAELRVARYRELVTLRSNLLAMRVQIQRAKHRGASS